MNFSPTCSQGWTAMSSVCLPGGYETDIFHCKPTQCPHQGSHIEAVCNHRLPWTVLSLAPSYASNTAAWQWTPDQRIACAKSSTNNEIINSPTFASPVLFPRAINWFSPIKWIYGNCRKCVAQMPKQQPLWPLYHIVLALKQRSLKAAAFTYQLSPPSCYPSPLLRARRRAAQMSALTSH